MTTLSVTPKKAGKIMQRMFTDLKTKLPLTGRQVMYRALLRVRNRMGKRGKQPTYPINWASDRQRRAFFATNGFGRGIPTARTNQYSASWKVTRNKEGYSITNDTGYAKFIGGNAYGLQQSPIHKRRWQLFRDVFEEEIDELPEEMMKEMFIVGRRVVQVTA